MGFLSGTVFGGIVGWTIALYMNVRTPNLPAVKIMGIVKLLIGELVK